MFLSFDIFNFFLSFSLYSVWCSTALMVWTTKPWVNSSRVWHRPVPGLALTSSTELSWRCCPWSPSRLPVSSKLWLLTWSASCLRGQNSLWTQPVLSSSQWIQVMLVDRSCQTISRYRHWTQGNNIGAVFLTSFVYSMNASKEMKLILLSKSVCICAGIVQDSGYDGSRLWNDWRNLFVLHGFHWC